MYGKYRPNAMHKIALFNVRRKLQKLDVLTIVKDYMLGNTIAILHTTIRQVLLLVEHITAYH